MRLIIDTDPGVDDAIALLMAIGHADVEIAGIISVDGNVPVAQTTLNCLRILELLQVEDIPVYRGAAGPLVQQPHRAYHIHGADGLGDVDLPPPRLQPQAEHGVLALIRLIRANPDATLLTLGPLTNLALAFRLDPELPGLIRRMVVMGGAIDARGNISPVAEFNIAADPEAGRVVLTSGAPITLIAWEPIVRHAVPQDILARLGRAEKPRGRFLAAILRPFLERVTAAVAEDTGAGLQTAPPLPLADPLAMAVAIAPEIVTLSEAHIADVELAGEFTRGQTILDRSAHWSVSRAKVQVVQHVDQSQFESLLGRTVGPG